MSDRVLLITESALYGAQVGKMMDKEHGFRAVLLCNETDARAEILRSCTVGVFGVLIAGGYLPWTHDDGEQTLPQNQFAAGRRVHTFAQTTLNGGLLLGPILFVDSRLPPPSELVTLFFSGAVKPRRCISLLRTRRLLAS